MLLRSGDDGSPGPAHAGAMGIDLSLPELGTLTVLALVDATSTGTLVLPLVLLLTPGIRARSMALYLATIGLFYLGVGLLLTGGLSWVLERHGQLLDGRPAALAQAVLAAALLWGSWSTDPKVKARRTASRRSVAAGYGGPAEPGADGPAGDGTGKWSRRAAAVAGHPGALIGLALAAGVVEVATMLPYLAAAGIVGSAGLSPAGTAVVLAGYCLVMVLPAALLTGLRALGGDRVEARLGALRTRLAAAADGVLTWVLGILGVLVGLDAVSRLLG